MLDPDLITGVAIGVVSNYVFKFLIQSTERGKELEADLRSDDPSKKVRAGKECMVNAVKWYLLANISWVVSGVTWVFNDMGLAQEAPFILFGSSLLAILGFAYSMRWFMKGSRAFLVSATEQNG